MARIFDGVLPSGIVAAGVLTNIPSSAISASFVSIGYECLDRYLFTPSNTYDALAETGVKWARCQTGWSRCEQTKGVYDFAWLDDVVTNLLSRGIQPWFNLGFGNTNYMANTFNYAAVGCVPLYYGAEAMAAWTNYVRAMVGHYAGKVTHWEIWNEPNVDSFWYPSEPDAREFLRFLKLTADLVRTADASAKIGFCTSGTLNNFVRDLITNGVAASVDFYAVHAYQVVPEESNYLENMAALRQLFDANGGSDVELWQGEAGFASWFPAGHWLHPTVFKSEANQAKWLLRRFVTDARAGCAVSSFFQAVDLTERPYVMARTVTTNPARHGLLTGTTYEKKMSYHAFCHYNAVLAKATLCDSISVAVSVGSAASPKIPLGLAYLSSGQPLYLYYMPVDVQAGYTGGDDAILTVTDSVTGGPSDPVLVDLLRGGCYSLTQVNRFGSTVTYSGLPLTDYPLVILDRAFLPK